MLPDFVEDLGHNVFALDTGFHRPRFDAAYLVLSDEGRAAFIDTGTNHTLPRHLAALDALGVPRDAVEFVIPTHVHLDHAGGAGALMQALPAATMWVHPHGKRHMVDPSALFQGALAIYGAEAMQRDYGTVVPVAAERVRTTHDGMDLMLGSRRLHFIDTPGHARHHHCLWDERSRGWFTGDTFGVSYREFDVAGRGPWIAPAATPVQFEPEALRVSVQRLLAADPACMYLTHYGRAAPGPFAAAGARSDGGGRPALRARAAAPRALEAGTVGAVRNQRCRAWREDDTRTARPAGARRRAQCAGPGRVAGS
jgi:glyoxylase-like metal-dependent hydrolase (beta-lactamase superfamily II)